jgi:hypothetical protein
VANRLLLLPALILTACAAEPTESAWTELDQAALHILDGSPEGVGVLSLLNASTTTESVLDHDVPLNRRSAQNLIAWRDGADGVRYTSDDRSFETIGQVDAVSWVGPAALDALVAFADAQDLVPSGGDLLGVWDNTAFTVDEADAALALVNLGDYALLDDDVPLNRRAADNIVAARPFSTVLQLAAVPQVGPSTMLRVRNFAQTWSPVAEDGDAELWEDCESEDACADGLICLGAISWGNGWCVEDTYAATFEIDSGAAVPDGDPAGLLSTVEVTDLASVPIDIAVWIDLDHPDPQSLTYRLIDPNGADATLSAPGEGNRVDILRRNITSDDEIHGPWSLEIIDPVAGNTGTLNGWTLYLTSTYD